MPVFLRYAPNVQARDVVQKMLREHVKTFQQQNGGLYPPDSWIRAKELELQNMALQLDKKHNRHGGD